MLSFIENSKSKSETLVTVSFPFKFIYIPVTAKQTHDNTSHFSCVCTLRRGRLIHWFIVSYHDSEPHAVYYPKPFLQICNAIRPIYSIQLSTHTFTCLY